MSPPPAQMLVTDEATQFALLGAIFEVWANNEQLKSVLTERLLKMDILNSNTIISWIFRLKEELCKMYLWELINSVIRHTKYQLQAADLNDENEQLAGRLECLLLNIVQQCAAVLTQHKPSLDNDDTDYWFNWVIGHMQAVFFNYIDDFNRMRSKLRQTAADLKDCQRFSQMIDNYLDYIQ